MEKEREILMEMLWLNKEISMSEIKISYSISIDRRGSANTCFSSIKFWTFFIHIAMHTHMVLTWYFILGLLLKLVCM